MRKPRPLITFSRKFRITTTRVRAGAICRQYYTPKCDARRTFMRPFLTETFNQCFLRSQKTVGVFTADNISSQKIKAGLSRPFGRILRTPAIPQAFGQPFRKRSQTRDLGTSGIACLRLAGQWL